MAITGATSGIGSAAALQFAATTAKRSAYSAGKRGLVGMVQAAALDYAAQGIRINTLIPGTTDTEFLRKASATRACPSRSSASA